MPNNDRVKQVKNAITEHLKTVGARDWDEVQKDFLDIPMSSFWRYVDKAKQQLTKPTAPNVTTDLFSPKERSAEAPEVTGLNAPFRALKHAQRLFELYADILALRQHALDADGRIVDTQLFAKTVRLRKELLVEEQSILNSIDAAEANTEFVDRLAKAINSVPPEVGKAAMAALDQCNEDMREAARKDPELPA